MMQQINPGLMKVLAAQSQINPVTPEGAPSVAANVLAQAGQAPGIAAIGQQAQEALPSMMRNAQDDQARQMLEAANRASQPAGIAGLNIPMGQYAEGGVVGFTEGGMPKIPVGEATETGKIWSEEAKRWLKELLERQQATEAGKTAAPKVAEVVESSPSKLRTFVQGLRNVGSSGLRSAFSLPGAAVVGVGSLLSNRAAEQMQQSPELRAAYENYMLGAMDPEGSMAAAILSQPTTPGPDQTLRERLGLGNEANRKVLESIDNLATKPQPTPVDTDPARFVWGQGMDPRQIISVLNNQLKTDKELTPENRTAIAKEIERQYEIYRSQQPIVTAEESARRAAGSTAAGEAAYQVPGQALYQDVLQKIGQLQAPSSRTEEEIQSQREAAYARRGLPNLRQAAEDRIRQTTAFDEESRRQIAEANKAAMQNAWAAGIMQPGARNLAELFGGAARSMIGEEGRQAQAAIAQRALARAQLLLDNQIREALDRADIAAANGDLVTEQAEKTKAQEFAIKKQELQINAMTARAKDEAQYGTQMGVARLNADQRERAALDRAVLAEQKLAQGAQAKPVDRATILERYADNWEKLDPMQKNDLKAQGIKTFDDYVQYRDRLLSGQTSPSVGQPMYARNPTTNERIMSTDGGVTWKTVQ